MSEFTVDVSGKLLKKIYTSIARKAKERFRCARDEKVEPERVEKRSSGVSVGKVSDTYDCLTGGKISLGGSWRSSSIASQSKRIYYSCKLFESSIDECKLYAMSLDDLDTLRLLWDEQEECEWDELFDSNNEHNAEGERLPQS